VKQWVNPLQFLYINKSSIYKEERESLQKNKKDTRKQKTKLHLRLQSFFKSICVLLLDPVGEHSCFLKEDNFPTCEAWDLIMEDLIIS
jgi:hypothetical protein